ncbi:MAG: hypothetical protein K8W52_22200 [Deltaproteobacteria bacterium]|nr:hypothetical protein [Deltaproteobacteria bacterium]
MPRISLRVVAATAALLTPLAPMLPAVAAPPMPTGDPMVVAPAPYESIVASVAEMVSDGDTVEMVHGKGLDLVNVMWEDTGRYEDSAVGPNISDVTIEVQGGGAGSGRRTYLMPVMRNANFADKTADVKLDKIFLPVGNQRGAKLKTITLRQFLADPGAYLSLPRKGRIRGGSLLARRDSHALVSAQHAFLPVPADGQATFWPVIFNYASSAKNPGVLTVLVTRQGASATIIDNTRDTVGDGSWGQRLYFNKDGQRAPLIAERLKDVQHKGTTANGEAAASLGEDANLLMLIQIPLKQPERVRVASPGYAEGAALDDGDMAPAPMASGASAGGGMVARDRRSDVDTAVLGNGPTEGAYTELDGLTIERDPRFPVRVTVQFYQATSNGVVSQADVDRMAAQIAKVYAAGDYVGSLVVPGPTAAKRPTSWTGAGPAPRHLSWQDFPGLVERAQRYLPFPTGLIPRS